MFTPHSADGGLRHRKAPFHHLFCISSAFAEISSAFAEISSVLVEISSELVQISSELVSISTEPLIISVFRKNPPHWFTACRFRP